MARQGCDFVDHGWRWVDYHGIDEAIEREHIRLSVETIRRLTGTRPIGWYIGTPSANTRRLVVEEGGFLYDSDAYNDELPLLDLRLRPATSHHPAHARRQRHAPRAWPGLGVRPRISSSRCATISTRSTARASRRRA